MGQVSLATASRSAVRMLMGLKKKRGGAPSCEVIGFDCQSTTGLVGIRHGANK